MGNPEIVLTGGRTTQAVVRIGDTVRRPPAPNAKFVQSLLRHLEVAGFAGAPRYLGRDARGREIFSYLPGVVPVELRHYGDETLAAAACLIRRYHDATASLIEVQSAPEAGIEVVCHNDLSPCNTVFRDGNPVALIDFDAAAPGSRARDLGYAAWLWLDIGNSKRSATEQVRRLRLFLAAYGPAPSATEIIDAMLVRQSILIAEGARTGSRAMLDWAAKCRDWTLQHMRAAAL
jgi:hypothetical protein